VLESIEIMEESQKSIEIEQKNKNRLDEVSNIFELIKIMCNYNVEKREVEREIIEARAIARGFNKEIIDNTIINYQNLGVLRVKDNIIKLID
jgi:hypothetical protein